MSDCPECFICGRQALDENTSAKSFLDGVPLNEGHTLIVPKRHVATYQELSPEEREDLWSLVDRVTSGAGDQYNIGMNNGPAAGQTIGHLHVHVIPRHSGDTAEPRGAMPVGGLRRLQGFGP